LPIFWALAEGNPRLSQRPERKYDGRQKWRLRRPGMEHSWLNRRAGNCQLKMLLLRSECVVVLECYHLTVEVWWCLNVNTSLWMCGGAGMLSLHSGYMVALECFHFTVDVWWHWNVITSLWMCGDAGMLSLHCGCVVVLEC